MSELTQRLSTAIADRYKIEREVGAGGMATVYLAQDVKHDRHVALKVLRPELAAVIGADRFLQEIKVTANLQHPNILALYDSGEADSFLYYVMPYIEGESLRDTLDREKHLAVDDAVEIARGVASALDYAHRHDVIHRDIKPENILLHDGRPVVADFGIALAVSTAGGHRLTETGLSLGTPHYMSPEQSMGDREIDARSDIYSLGAMLYEMLAGEPPFTGPTAQAIVAKVITEKPAMVTMARDTVPRHVALTIYRALAKLPADRWPSAVTFAEALVRPRTADTDAYPLPHGETLAGVPAAAGRPGWRAWVTDPRSVALVIVMIGALVLGVQRRSDSAAGAEPISASFTVALPAGERFVTEPPAVSPDGRILVYVVRDTAGQRLRVQSLDAFGSRIIDGTEGARRPFFSGDGARIGFWVGGSQVAVVPIAGGRPQIIGTLPVWGDQPLWAADGRILVGQMGSGIWALKEGGGDAEQVTFLDTAGGERGHLYPRALPGGRLLFSVVTDSGFGLATQAADAASHERLSLALEGPAEYVKPGVLVFRAAGRVHAVAFDPHAARVRGTPVPIDDAIAPRYPDSWRRAPAVGGGTAAYIEVLEVADRRLMWVDRAGGRTPIEGIRGDLRWPRLSPGGDRVAVGGIDGTLDEEDIWVIDLASGTRVRLLAPGLFHTEPVWTRDGTRVTYSYEATPFPSLGWQPADGSGQSERVHAAPFEAWATDWSPDGSELLFYGTGGVPAVDDMFVVDLDGNRRATVGGAGDQRGGRFSPDGRWIAYQSSETGHYEVYVQPYPSLDRKWAVSVGGGTEPVWAPNGRDLFFRNGDRLMVVSVSADSTFAAGTPTELFRGVTFNDPAGDQSYDVSPDGRRFLMIDPGPESAVELRVIVNWGERLAAFLRERQAGRD